MAYPNKFNKGGFQNKGGFGNKSAASKPSTGTGNLFFSAKWGKYNENDELEIRLGAFKSEDINVINQVAPDVFYVKAIQIKLAKYPSYSIFVKKGQVGKFEGMLDTLQTALENTQHYSKVKEGIGTIQDIIEDTPSNEELAQQEKTMVTSWRDMLKMFQDPEVRKRFLAFQTTFIRETEFSKAVLSRDNVLQILSVDPQATFVTQAYVWRNTFKRTIQQGAPSIIYTKVDIDIPQNILDKDPEVIRRGGWKEVIKQSGGKKTNYPAWGIQNRIAKEPGHSHFMTFRKVKGYDVRWTIPPTNPNDDVFVNAVNLVNNLTGELNDYAKQILQQEDVKSGNAPREFKKIEGLANDELLTRFKDFTFKKCKTEKVNVTETGNLPSDIANGVYAYSHKRAESQNILKDDERNIFASAVVAGVGLTFNIDCDKVKQCGRVISGLNDQKLMDIVDKSFHTFQEFNNFKIQEADSNISKSEYFNLLKTLQNEGVNSLQESFLRNFNSLSERMNNVPR